jgi:hypothetical protein
MFSQSALGRINMDFIIKNVPMDVLARAQQVHPAAPLSSQCVAHLRLLS